MLLCWSRLESLPEGVGEPEEEGSDGRMQALLAALELMEVPEDAAEAAENPYYGTQAVAEALAFLRDAGRGERAHRCAARVLGTG